MTSARTPWRFRAERSASPRWLPLRPLHCRAKNARIWPACSPTIRCGRCKVCRASPPTTISTRSSRCAAPPSTASVCTWMECCCIRPSTPPTAQSGDGSLTIFNGDMTDDMTLYEGAWPVRYSDRTAGILAVDTREGNRQGFQGRLDSQRVERRRAFRRTYRQEAAGIMDRIVPQKLSGLHPQSDRFRRPAAPGLRVHRRRSPAHL